MVNFIRKFIVTEIAIFTEDDERSVGGRRLYCRRIVRERCSGNNNKGHASARRRPLPHYRLVQAKIVSQTDAFELLVAE